MTEVQWHGTWQGERSVMLEVDDEIEAHHVTILSTIQRGNSPIPERIFVVTGPSFRSVRMAITDWARTRGVTVV